MYPYEIFNKAFKKESLIQCFNDKISLNKTSGIDYITRRKFSESLDDNVDLIIRKVNNSSYKFTRYKKILISKGEKKVPRVVNIPTIRDSLTLKSINEVLTCVYKKTCVSPLPHVLINKIIKTLEQNEYDCFIKIDIKQYYSSIDHSILMKLLKKRTKKKILLYLVSQAISTTSIEVPKLKREENIKRKKGIPEGLSISNSLANIYLHTLDCKYTNQDNLKYFRYVDDILILCNEKHIEGIKKMIEDDLDELSLEINEKSSCGVLSDTTFNYLGYIFDKNRVSVRESSVLKIENSLSKLFINYKNKKIDKKLFIWKLNLRITGCIIEDKKYGWLFFFSQINDLSLLYHLDWLIDSLAKRYGFYNHQKIKSFVRTFNEIKYRLHTSTYLINLDKFTLADKIKILEDIYERSIKAMESIDIEKLFNNILYKEITDLERDIQFIS